MKYFQSKVYAMLFVQILNGFGGSALFVYDTINKSFEYYFRTDSVNMYGMAIGKFDLIIFEFS